MQIQFRECDWSNLWIWFEFNHPPTDADRKHLEQVLESWYTLGMLGGFNAESMLAQDAGVDLSFLEYDPEQDVLPSLMHNMATLEYENNWGRCWFDLGTADALSLDVLLNALNTLSLEYIELQTVIVGGQNEDWPIPEEDLLSLNGFEGYSDNHLEE